MHFADIHICVLRIDIFDSSLGDLEDFHVLFIDLVFCSLKSLDSFAYFYQTPEGADDVIVDLFRALWIVVDDNKSMRKVLSW